VDSETAWAWEAWAAAEEEEVVVAAEDVTLEKNPAV
jgi:hypothetical protein